LTNLWFPCNSNCFSSFITICPGDLLVDLFPPN
jgi:hypothetical protein